MQTFFGEYIKKNSPKQTEAYELKFTKTKSIRFDALKDHQVEALLKAQEQNFYHKLTDPPVFYNMPTRFNVKRPFDCFCLVQVKSFVVVWFYKPREKKVFIKIPIQEFIRMKNYIPKKSFREEEALNYGQPIHI